ncbi:hypothetical protein RIF29_16180 [Crotalaria pallida]|uniref:Uncharacterized protein n=1 Tax=Crotalaria pallida TaxID=3830 RepID=A0AAN9FN87_CROPI
MYVFIYSCDPGGCKLIIFLSNCYLMKKFDLLDPIIKVPTLLTMGSKDYVLKFSRIEDLTKGEKAKQVDLCLQSSLIALLSLCCCTCT